MPKRKKKFRLPPGFGIFLGETIVKRAQQLIANGKLSDKGISNKLTKEGLRISPPYVSALRRSMGMPALYRKAQPLSPEVVNRARQLIAERELDDRAIARLMASESLLISAPTVGKIRHSMGIPPAATKRTLKEAQMRANQLKKFRLEFKALGREQIIAKWNRLKKIEQIIKRRRAGLGKLKNKERIGAFLNQLGEIQVQLEALFPLLPKEVQQAEAARFVKASEAMKKKQ